MPTASATWRIVTASAPWRSSSRRAAAVIRCAVGAATMYTLYTRQAERTTDIAGAPFTEARAGSLQAASDSLQRSDTRESQGHRTHDCKQSQWGSTDMNDYRGGLCWTPGLVVAGMLALSACATDDGSQGEAGDESSPAPGAPAAPATARCSASAADGEAASAMARACGSRVEVESERTEYSEVYVEPSGHHTLVASLVPQRARRLDGTWGAVDTTLARIGDQIAPTATH